MTTKEKQLLSLAVEMLYEQQIKSLDGLCIHKGLKEKAIRLATEIKNERRADLEARFTHN